MERGRYRGGRGRWPAPSSSKYRSSRRTAGSDSDSTAGSDSDSTAGSDSDGIVGSDSDGTAGSDSDSTAGSGARCASRRVSVGVHR